MVGESSIFVVVSYFSASVLSVGQFRSDYRYYKEVNGWVKLHKVPANWKDARLRCLLEDAVLASPLTEQLRKAMKDVIVANKLNPRGLFTGIHATFSIGDYYSIEGVPLSKIPANWGPEQPNHYDPVNETCLTIQDSGTLNDVLCCEMYPYICYKKHTIDLKQTVCGTTDTGYTDIATTGSCYKIHYVGRPWSRAFKTCSAEGGHLAILNSPQEAEIIKDLVLRNPENLGKAPFNSTVFLGFQDWEEHGTWMTIHGQYLRDAGYSTWSSVQPNNKTTIVTGSVGQYCGALDLPSGLLKDMWCHVPQAYVCEKNPYDLRVAESLDNVYL